MKKGVVRVKMVRIFCICEYRRLNLRYQIHYLLSLGLDSGRIELLNGLYLVILEEQLSCCCGGTSLLRMVLGE